MLRYEISSCRRADPLDIWRLERAFDRAGVDRGDGLTGVEVSGTSGSLVVVMEFTGSRQAATRECERLFASAWYDAFGVRGSAHLGRFIEKRAPRLARPVAVLTRALK